MGQQSPVRKPGPRSEWGGPGKIMITCVLMVLAGLAGPAWPQAATPGRIAGGAGLARPEKRPGGEVMPTMILNPIGRVTQVENRVVLEIKTELPPALHGLADFSHIWVLYWFHENDTSENRRLLKVHPRRDPRNPLTGVFATRAPVRPNFMGLTACRLVEVRGNRVEVEGLDAQPGSPLLDLKPYIPGNDALPEAQTPEWVRGQPPES